MLKTESCRFDVQGMNTQIIRPGVIWRLRPIVDVTRLIGGPCDHQDGSDHLQRTTHAFATVARNRGAKVTLRNRMQDLQPVAEGWRPVTEA